MTRTVKGVLAVVRRRSKDGRRLDPSPMDKPVLPLLPVLHPSGSPAGVIDRVWLDGDLLRFTARVTGEVALLAHTELSVLGADMDRCEIEYDDLEMIFKDWRLRGATVIRAEDKAWPEVCLEVDEGPEKESSPPADVAINARTLNDLMDDRRKLRALEAAGVDNWDGYQDAMRMMREEEDGDDG